jgi:hypothetical protein
LRKYLIAAVAALTAVACTAGVAQAQNPAPAPELTVGITPTKAGTKKKPKSGKVTLRIENNVESKTTMTKLQIDMDRMVRLSGRGLTRCTRAVLNDQGPAGCPRASRAGGGLAHALVGPHAPSPTNLTLDVEAFVGGPKTIFFRVEGRELPVVGLIEAKITRGGRRLTLTIPENLSEPAEGVFSALVDLEATISRKKGKNSLFSTRGCQRRQHSTKATLTYGDNPVAPAERTASDTATTRCRK